jgi:hypothetical protein
MAQQQEEEKNTERKDLSRDSMSGGQDVDGLAAETEAVETAGDNPKERGGEEEEESKEEGEEGQLKTAVFGIHWKD